RRRILVIALVAFAVAAVAVAIPAYMLFTRNVPAVYTTLPDEFKYGSAGTEAQDGVPYDIWSVLPTVFSDLLPAGRGHGWARFGFIYEPGRSRPIGISYRKEALGLVGVN